MVRAFLVLSLLAFVPFVSGCRLNTRAQAAELPAVPIGYQVGQRAPDFELLSVGEGRSLRLSELRGKPVIINFFCGCNFCSTVGREWVKNRDKMGSTALVAVMVNHWSYAPQAIRDFRVRTGWAWPTLADMQSRTAGDYHALSCPRLFVLDPQGVIRYASPDGASDEKQLIADALAAAHAR